MLEKTRRDCQTDRRHFIGGSGARIIMGRDEKALIRLWQEKRGEVGPEDLSGNLIVQLGLATEDLSRTSKGVAPPASFAGFPKRPSRLRRSGNSPESYARCVTVGKFDSQTVEPFANFLASRSESADGLRSAGLHIPNRIVAHADLLSQSLLIKPQQGSGRP
jgi:hypothetical protein